MAIDTWQGDACSLVEAFRRGDRSPPEELAAVYDAIDASDLNAFCYVDREPATQAAADADVHLPFGGVPIGVKELDAVTGWPYTEASVPLKDRVAGHTSHNVERIRDRGGAVLVGLTTASESAASTSRARSCTARPTTHGSTGTRPAARRAARLQPSPVGSSPWRRRATAAGRSGSRPASAAWSG
jgi:aspartyl-tRNA(Asn)/glutamyl-tRNA(Gln) amidotransferase subunit A